MASKLCLKTDKSSIKKGDSVLVTWTSEAPDSLYLLVEDGDSVQRFPVSDSGSRLCWSNRATKNMTFTLLAVTGSKRETVKTKVRVKTRKNVNLKEKWQAGWAVYKAQLKYSWQAMKTWQKVLWLGLWILALVLFIMAIVK
ncbi:MAG: hypothetical protein ACI3ZK_02695 [Candidatus Cryptobacteroides sp.]